MAEEERACMAKAPRQTAAIARGADGASVGRKAASASPGQKAPRKRSPRPARTLAEPGVSAAHGETVAARFDDRDSAKRALDRLAREIPLQPRQARLRKEAGVLLEVPVDPAHAARAGTMLRRWAGRAAMPGDAAVARDIDAALREEIAQLRAQVRRLSAPRPAPGSTRLPIMTSAAVAAVAFLLGRLTGGWGRGRAD
jgi:hypothetical protein